MHRTHTQMCTGSHVRTPEDTHTHNYLATIGQFSVLRGHRPHINIRYAFKRFKIRDGDDLCVNSNVRITIAFLR